MKSISPHSQIIQSTLEESLVDFNTLIPNDVLGIVFDDIVNQKKQPLGDISSVLLTCKTWKCVLEKNPCISLVQALFQPHGESTTMALQDQLSTEQKKDFTSQELKLIDRFIKKGVRFHKLLMVKSNLFQPNSLFLPLLNRYYWNVEFYKGSANKNIRDLVENQLHILNSLIVGSDDQRLTWLKSGSIEKLYWDDISPLWNRATASVISTLKKFPNFNDKKIFIQIAHYFGRFDINESLKKDREIVLIAVNRNGMALGDANESLKKDHEIVLAAVNQEGWALQFADESLKKDREIVLAAVQQHGSALFYADVSFKQDREIVLAAVNQEGGALIGADESLKKDREIVLAAVQQSGWALQYADASLKQDREVVLAAVKQSGMAIQYSDASLKQDPEIVFWGH